VRKVDRRCVEKGGLPLDITRRNSSRNEGRKEEREGGREGGREAGLVSWD